jgi:DNA-binding GntR family transcriptional regulator
VREVFGSLEERGLIERIPNRGAVVTRLDPDQVFHLFDVREVLEAQAVRLATERQPPASWQDLVELFGAASEAMIERGELETYIGHLALLRRRTVDGAGNPLLADLLDTLHDRTRVLIRRLVILPGRARAGLREHRAVLAAMRQGDAQTAERLKRDNIRGARDSFRQYQKFIL